MIQAVLKDTMVNISKTTGDGCWILGVDLKDIMFNTYKTVGDGCWILGVELKNTVFNPPKTALLQLFRPPSLFHSYVSEYSNSVSSANFFHEKKYFSS